MTVLQEKLRNQLISFDNRVYLLDLSADYEDLPVDEVVREVQQYIDRQESDGSKFLKWFCVGGEELNSSNEIFSIVEGETKAKERLSTLKNGHSSLYAVEAAGGGAEAPAARVFKPVQRSSVHLRDLQIRVSVKTEEPAGSAALCVQQKAATAGQRSPTTGETARQTELKHSIAKAADMMNSKTSPEKKVSPRKDIATFFAAGAAGNAAGKKPESKMTAVLRQRTPKKLQDFFAKQTAAPRPPKPAQPAEIRDSPKAQRPTVSAAKKAPSPKRAAAAAKKAANTSVQLFAASSSEDEEEQDRGRSSDDEPIRKTSTPPIEESATTKEAALPEMTASKRRRLADSSDEESPKQKQDKKDDTTTTTSAKGGSMEYVTTDLYVDDEGYLVTKKAMKCVPSAATTPAPAATAKAAKRSPPAAATSKPKTKQGTIASFFAKK